MGAVFLRPRDWLCCCSFSFPLLLHLRFPVAGTAQPLLLLQPIATPTMGGLMGLRAPTSATCTSRTRLTPPAFQGVAVTRTITVIRQDFISASFPLKNYSNSIPSWLNATSTNHIVHELSRQTPTATLTAMTPTAARTPMPVVGEPTTPASIGLRLSSAVSRTMVS